MLFDRTSPNGQISLRFFFSKRRWYNNHHFKHLYILCIFKKNVKWLLQGQSNTNCLGSNNNIGVLFYSTTKKLHFHSIT